MTKSIKIMFGAAAFLAAGMLAAQTMNLNKTTAWVKNGKISEANGMITTKGCYTLMTAQNLITINPAKSYTISFMAKAEGLKDAKSSAMVYGGFLVFDKNNKEISSWHIGIVPNTLTEVAVDAKKGSNFVLVKDLSKVAKVYSHYYLAAGAKADLSDLPNSNFIGQNMKSLTKEGKYWKITFNRPIFQDAKAGTPVRIQSGGGYMYPAGGKPVKGDWVKFQGTVKGFAPKGVWTYNAWPQASVKARMIILSNWGSTPVAVQYKDITITEK